MMPPGTPAREWLTRPVGDMVSRNPIATSIITVVFEDGVLPETAQFVPLLTLAVDPSGFGVQLAGRRPLATT
jgi:hypothetical protein